MNKWLGASLAGTVLFWGTMAMGQGKPVDCQPSGAPERVEGQVVKVDHSDGKVTIRGSDGRLHEFQASSDTAKDLKVGDRIEVKLRALPKC